MKYTNLLVIHVRGRLSKRIYLLKLIPHQNVTTRYQEYVVLKTCAYCFYNLHFLCRYLSFIFPGSNLYTTTNIIREQEFDACNTVRKPVTSGEVTAHINRMRDSRVRITRNLPRYHACKQKASTIFSKGHRLNGYFSIPVFTLILCKHLSCICTQLHVTTPKKTN